MARAWILFGLRRLVLMIISLWALVTVTFLLVALLPSDPARAIAGPYATAAQIAAKAQLLGLDESLPVRYSTFVQQLLRGDLGTDVYTGEPVSQDLFSRLPSTLELIVGSIAIALIVGLAFGAISAYFHGKWQDRSASLVVGVVQSLPDFVIAVVLLYVFSYLLGVAPGPEGQLSIATEAPPIITGMTVIDTLLAGDLTAFGDAIYHAVLPVMTLGLVLGAVFARVSRVALREALESDQTKFARACGLSEWTVLKYAFLSSRTPILTYAAIMFGSLIGGTAIVETVYNWNGASQWAIEAMLKTDFPAIQAFVLVSGAITLVVYVVLDVLTHLLDPRIRLVQSR